MTSIHLKDLAQKYTKMSTSKSLYEELLSFKDNHFTVYLISRNYDLLKDEETRKLAKTWDYLYAAYFGHILFSVAEHFSCYIPDQESNEVIFFELGNTDILQFSNCLYDMIQVLTGATSAESEKTLHFLKEIICFHEKFENATEYKYDSCVAVEGLWNLYHERIFNIPHQFPDNLF